MKHTYRLLVLLVCLALFVPGRAAVALADDDAETATARERFQEGVRYFDQNEFGKARVAFMQAYALKKHPDVLLNLGLSEVRTPGYEVDAAAHLAEYLREADDPAKRKQAEQALKDAKNKVFTVNVEVDTQVSEVLVDDEPYTATPVPGPIFLQPGAYTIEVRVGEDRKRSDVTGDAGDERTLEFEFESDSEESAAAATAAEPATKKKTQKEKRPKKPEPASKPEREGRTPFFKWFSKRPVAVVLGAVGVAGAGSGVGFLLAAENEYNNADVLERGILARAQLDAANPNPDYADFRAAYATQAPCGADGFDPLAVNASDTRYVDWCREFDDTTARADDYRLISILSFGVGGAALVAIPVYYLLDSKPKKAATLDLDPSRHPRAIRIAPIVGSRANGLVIGGQF